MDNRVSDANNISRTSGTGRSLSGGPAAQATARPTGSMTVTETDQRAPEVLTLHLRARPSVTWDEAVINNEGMGKKSSKRCCIFHKQRPFGESSTDSSDEDHNAEDDSGKKRIARPKRANQVPDSQRYHA